MALLCVHRSKGHHALLCGANHPNDDNGGDNGSNRGDTRPAWEKQLAVIGVPDTERGSEDATVNSDNETDVDDQPGDGGNGEWKPGSGAGGGGSGSRGNRGGRGGGGKEPLRRSARISAGRRRGSSKTNVTERTMATHCSDSRPVLKTKLYDRASDSILRRVSSSEAVQPRCHQSEGTGKLTIKRWLGGGTFGEVFRAVADGVRCVVKFARKDEEAKRLLKQEANIYEKWLVDKCLPVPVFHGYYHGQAGDVLILQDCGLPIAHVSPAVWQQIRAAILQLHEASLHHHDLSLNNICIDSQGKIYILDWADAEEASECRGECSDATFLQRQLEWERTA
ncbi:kinase-like protein [Ramaria rubella]|nr:kinase-like protein [Ramaria rubella]